MNASFRYNNGVHMTSDIQDLEQKSDFENAMVILSSPRFFDIIVRYDQKTKQDFDILIFEALKNIEPATIVKYDFSLVCKNLFGVSSGTHGANYYGLDQAAFYDNILLGIREDPTQLLNASLPLWFAESAEELNCHGGGGRFVLNYMMLAEQNPLKAFVIFDPLEFGPSMITGLKRNLQGTLPVNFAKRYIDHIYEDASGILKNSSPLSLKDWLTGDVNLPDFRSYIEIYMISLGNDKAKIDLITDDLDEFKEELRALGLYGSADFLDTYNRPNSPAPSERSLNNLFADFGIQIK
jgi:hypothetical protein